MLNAAKAYLTTQVSTASQGDLLVMLYDTAIKHLRQAIEKMRAGDMAGKGILITKAITIICELQESLNKERGGEISKNLFHLYFFCNTRLLKANMKMSPEMVEEVITILSGLRQAFAQILPNQQGVASLTQPGAGGAASAAASAGPSDESSGKPVPVATGLNHSDHSEPEFCAALYAPAAVPSVAVPSAAPGAAPSPAASSTPAPASAAPSPELAAPIAPPAVDAEAAAAQAVRAPGLRLRAANAYATTR